MVVKALLIIDMQVCHFPPDDMPYRSAEVLDVQRSLIARARGRKVPVIFVQHCAGKGSDYEPDTPGWQIHPLLAPLEGEVIVRKWHPDSFQGTELESMLREKGIKKLIVAGMQSEMCIDTTVRRAYSLGFDVELVSDGHTTWSSKVAPAEVIAAHHNHVLGRRFAKALPHEQVDI
jgi:nicotinamidase-related amidase